MDTLKHQYKCIRKSITLILSQDTTIDPPLIVLIIAVVASQMDRIQWPAIYLLGIFLAVVLKFNVLFVLPVWAFIQSPIWSFITFLISACSCNAKWKTYIFFLVSAIAYSLGGPDGSDVTFAAMLSITVVTYKDLFFPTFKQNMQYFTGFFVISAIYLALTISNTLSMKLNLIPLGIFGFLAFNLARLITSQRI